MVRKNVYYLLIEPFHETVKLLVTYRFSRSLISILRLKMKNNGAPNQCPIIFFLIFYWECYQSIHFLAENKLYSQNFGVKSWIFFIIGTLIVYVKIKLYTKFDAKTLIRSKVMID